MAIVVIVAGVAAMLSVVALFLFQRKHPENLGSRDDRGAGRGRVPTVGRAQGPGAENMSADRPGGFVPPGEPSR